MTDPADTYEALATAPQPPVEAQDNRETQAYLHTLAVRGGRTLKRVTLDRAWPFEDCSGISGSTSTAELVFRGRPPAEAQAQGGGDAFAYMQDCSLPGVTHLKARGEPAVFTCLTVKDDLHTFPLYTAPPSAPVGVVCPNCGSSELTWDVIYRNKSGVADGRLRVHDVGCLFVLGCDECSGTVKVTRAEDVATSLAQQPAAVDGVCEWDIDEGIGLWGADCGVSWTFIEGGPTENKLRHCPTCGKPVVLAAQPGGSDNDQ